MFLLREYKKHHKQLQREDEEFREREREHKRQRYKERTQDRLAAYEALPEE